MQGPELDMYIYIYIWHSPHASTLHTAPLNTYQAPNTEHQTLSHEQSPTPIIHTHTPNPRTQILTPTPKPQTPNH